MAATSEQLSHILGGAAEVIKPTEELTVSEWAERHRRLTGKESANAGRWRNDRTPYLREIMDAMGAGEVDEVVLMCCAQAGKSESVRNALAYWIAQDPGPCLWVMPDEKSAKEALDERLIPMIRSSVPWALPGTTRDLTLSGLRLKSMDVYPAWAGSPQSMATRPCRYGIGDEIDKWPEFSGRDASPAALFKARLRTWKERKKCVLVSTPTTRSGAISKAYYACADQRDYRIPCPRCEKLLPLTWAQVKWPKREDTADRIRHAENVREEQLAWFECESCGHEIREAERHAAVKKGQWVSTLGLSEGCWSRRVAFHFNALCNPWANLSELVEKWLKAQGDVAALMEFVNQELGEPFEEQISKTTGETFEAKAAAGHQAGIVPPWAGLVIASADTQKDGFWWMVRAWGRDYRSRLLGYGFAHNFAELRSVTLDARYPVEDTNETMQPAMLLIDSGGAVQLEGDASTTDLVYQFAESDPARIIPVKGHGGKKRAAKLIATSVISSTDTGRRRRQFGQVLLRVLDTQSFKDILAHRIATDDPELWEEHQEIDAAYCQQMSSERKVLIREGKSAYQMWQPHSAHTPNHLWDAAVYQCAGAHMANVSLLPDEEELKAERKAIYQQRQRMGLPSTHSKFGDPAGRKFLANRR